MSGVNIDWSGFASLQQRQHENMQRDMQDTFDKLATRNAISGYREDPSNPAALDRLYAIDPKIGASFEDRAQKQASSNALSTFLNPATAGTSPMNALMPPPPVGQEAPSRLGANVAQQPRATRPNVSMDNPQFRNLMALDLDQATKVASLYGSMSKEERERDKHKMDVVGSLAMHLTGFPEEQRHSEMMRLAPQLRQSGFTDDDFNDNDLSDGGLQGYAAMAMDVKTILGQQRLDRRLEWDIEDDEIDNTRADRSTDSLVASRGASVAQGRERVAIQREGMQRTDARGRRGQDLSAETGRRGQDMVDRRAREGVGGARGRRAPAGANIPLGSPLSPTNAPIAPRAAPRGAPARQAPGRIIVNPQTGQRMQLRGKQWVPVQ